MTMTPKERTALRTALTESFEIRLDEAELTLRFVETCTGTDPRHRPDGCLPAELLVEMEATNEELRAMVGDLRECSKVAMHYFCEQIAGGASPPGGSMIMELVDPEKLQ